MYKGLQVLKNYGTRQHICVPTTITIIWAYLVFSRIIWFFEGLSGFPYLGLSG